MLERKDFDLIGKIADQGEKRQEKRLEEVQAELLLEIEKTRQKLLEEVKSIQDFLLDEIGITQSYLDRKIEQMDQKLTGVGQYYQSDHLNSDTISILIKNIGELSIRVSALEK